MAWRRAVQTEHVEVTDLKLVISRYAVKNKFNVQVHVTATPNQVNHGRMPADDEFDAGVKEFQPALIMVDIDLVRASSAMTVWLLAISENVVGNDDNMGTITAQLHGGQCVGPARHQLRFPR